MSSAAQFTPEQLASLGVLIRAEIDVAVAAVSASQVGYLAPLTLRFLRTELAIGPQDVGLDQLNRLSALAFEQAKEESGLAAQYRDMLRDCGGAR